MPYKKISRQRELTILLKEEPNIRLQQMSEKQK